jgi:hypothetical protein
VITILCITYGRRIIRHCRSCHHGYHCWPGVHGSARGGIAGYAQAGRSDSTSSAIPKAPREDSYGATGGYVYPSDDDVMSVAAGKRPAIAPPEPKRLRIGASGGPRHAPTAAAKSAIASSSKAAAATSAVSASMSTARAGAGSAIPEEGEEGDVEEDDEKDDDGNDEDSGSDDMASNASMPSTTPPSQQRHQRPHQPTKGGPSLPHDAFPSIDVAASVEANIWQATALELEKGLQQRRQEHEQTVQPGPPVKNGEGIMTTICPKASW